MIYKAFLSTLFLMSLFISYGQESVTESFGGIFKSAESGKKYLHYNDTSSSIIIDTVPVISISEFKIVKKKYNKEFKQYELLITLTDEGTKQFARVSKENIGKPLAIIINNKLLAAPIVNQEINGGKLMITGIDKKTVKEILSFF